MFALSADLIEKFHRPAPRYTSYPTAPVWQTFSATSYVQKLTHLSTAPQPLSLYFHIPFCKTMCLYCGCSVVLNRRPENEENYVTYLCREMEMVYDLLKQRFPVTQLHFGGGTPTQLSIPQFARLLEKIHTYFSLQNGCELSIEIDPRTVLDQEGEKLKQLKAWGFNRVSFGVQDTDPRVQEAVKRRQSLEMTQKTYYLAKSLGFSGINIDLIYGLPLQTLKTFQKTIDDIIQMNPDRIALFSYAKVPWLKPHQKAIADETLPSVEEKFQIYAQARHTLLSNGYVAIGMDHFARPEDSLAQAYFNKTLQRNFQGYSLKLAQEHLGLGVSAVGWVQGAYVQNEKDLKLYYAALDQNTLPVHRGWECSAEDLLRKWVIHTLMCTFELCKKEFQTLFQASFDAYFSACPFEQLEKEGLIRNTPEKIEVTPLGELFIRLVVLEFDAYLVKDRPKPLFSQSI